MFILKMKNGDNYLYPNCKAKHLKSKAKSKKVRKRKLLLGVAIEDVEVRGSSPLISTRTHCRPAVS